MAGLNKLMVKSALALLQRRYLSSLIWIAARIVTAMTSEMPFWRTISKIAV